MSRATALSTHERRVLREIQARRPASCLTLARQELGLTGKRLSAFLVTADRLWEDHGYLIPPTESETGRWELTEAGVRALEVGS